MKKTISTVACIMGMMLLIHYNVNAQLWWGDEFNGSGSPSSSNWNIDNANGGFGNNELQYYTSRTSNVTQGNNCLQLIARRESYGGNAYTSGKITSFGKRQFGSGWIEGRMSIPMGQGLWPAFWMLGVNIGSAGWPACGEIDIMEHINNEQGVHGTIHWAGPNGENWSYGNYGSTSPSGWHNYQINWNQYSIKWYIDAVQYNAANITNNINSTEEFHRDFFIILNLAVGGNWPGNPDGSTPFPSTLWVDYVRVYQPSSAARENTMEIVEDITGKEEAGDGVYPNPVRKGNSFTVNVKNYNPTALVNVGLIDLTGKIIASETSNKQTVTVSTGENMKEGVYLLQVTNGTNRYTKRLKVE
jgi:beta-glucanase (GH16 family)